MVISGSLRRQLQTALEIVSCLGTEKAPGVRLITDERFNELDIDSQFQCIVPQLEILDEKIAELFAARKRSSRAYHILLKQVFSSWQTHGALPVSVESWAQFCVRVKTAVADIQHGTDRGTSVIVVTSGGVIANIVRMTLDLPTDAFYSLFEMIMNGSVTRLIYDRTRISLRSFNESSYLWADEDGVADPQLLTFL
jgi:broad specificity phosphatase PhoE